VDAIAIIIAIIITLRLLTRWMARRSDEISDFYSDDENSPVVETLLHMNQSRGNHR
jgi:hypothetical protein